MSRATQVFSYMAVLGLAFPAYCEDFPLTFKTFDPKDRSAFPGGYGCESQVQVAKPAWLKKEPPPISKKPFYGEFVPLDGSSKSMYFRVDESQGNGRGYDQIIVDLNRNNDLTDDLAAGCIQQDKTSGKTQMRIFGPLQLKSTMAGQHPVYFVDCFLNPEKSFGNTRLRAGWYLEATVTFKGGKEKVAIMDADNNFKLGDRQHASNLRERWDFSGGDIFLTDKDGSGKFDPNILCREITPFGPVYYHDGEPYKMALAKDGASLQVTPWDEPLAKVQLQPAGEQVESIDLAQKTGSQWQLIKVDQEWQHSGSAG